MRRCLNCGITSGIKDSANFCHACGGNQFESTTNNKNQDFARRVKTLEKKMATIEAQIQRQQKSEDAELAEPEQKYPNQGIDRAAELRTLQDELRHMKKRLRNAGPDGRLTLICQIAQINSEILISELDLSTRAFNCLTRAGIKSLADISEKTVEDIMKIRSLGRETAEEIVNRCSDFGVTLLNARED